MKPLYIATSPELAKSRQFKTLIRLVKAKCTLAVVIKLFNDKYGQISMNSEPIGTLLRFSNDHTIAWTTQKLRRSKRLTITQLETWKREREAINRAVVTEMEAAKGWTSSIH